MVRGLAQEIGQRAQQRRDDKIQTRGRIMGPTQDAGDFTRRTQYHGAFQGEVTGGELWRGLSPEMILKLQQAEEEIQRKRMEQQEHDRLNQRLGEGNLMGQEVGHALQLRGQGGMSGLESGIPQEQPMAPSESVMSHLDQLSKQGGGEPSLLSQGEPSQSMGVQPTSLGQQPGFGLDTGLQQPPQGGMLEMPQQAQQFAQEAQPEVSPDIITPQEREQYRPLGLHTLPEDVQDKMIWKYKNGMYKSDADFYRDITNTLKEKHELDKTLHEFGQKEGIKQEGRVELEGTRQEGRQRQAEESAQLRREIAQLQTSSRERIATTPSRSQQGKPESDFGDDINRQERTVQVLARELENSFYLPEEEQKALQSSFNLAQRRLHNLHIAERLMGEGMDRSKALRTAPAIFQSGLAYYEEGGAPNNGRQINLAAPGVLRSINDLLKDYSLEEILSKLTARMGGQ